MFFRPHSSLQHFFGVLQILKQGMMARKDEGKRKEAWEAGGEVFHVVISSSLHSPDYIPSFWPDSFSNFSQPREDRLRRRH